MKIIWVRSNRGENRTEKRRDDDASSVRFHALDDVAVVVFEFTWMKI